MNSYFFRSIFALVIIASSVGCLGGYPGLHGEQPWTLTVSVSEERQKNGTIHITGEVGLDGSYKTNTSVSHIRVCAIDEDGRVLTTVQVGNVTGTEPEKNVTLSLRRVPSKLVLDYETIESNSNHDIEGLKRIGERRYSTIYQDGPRCGENHRLKRSALVRTGEGAL